MRNRIIAAVFGTLLLTSPLLAASSRPAQLAANAFPAPVPEKSLGVKDAFDAQESVFGGTKYLRSLLDRFNGNVDVALAAYNAGPELVAKVGPAATQEAVAYVAAIKSYYQTALRSVS